MKLPIRSLALAGVALTGGLLAACGASSPSPSATTDRIEVSAKEFSFTPADFTISAGETVEIVLSNDGVVEHDMTIEIADFLLAAPIGETVTGTLGPLDAGTYEIYCSVVGHKEAGMTGTLTVE